MKTLAFVAALTALAGCTDQSLSTAPTAPSAALRVGVTPRWPDRSALRAGTVTGSQWSGNLIGENSVAFGKDARASGDQAFATGYETVASFNSTAIGSNTTASGYRSFAAGGSSSATGGSAIAMGGNAIAANDFATAIGSQVKALGAFSLALGTGSEANAIHAMGSNTQASGKRSFVSGFASQAMGEVSFVWGEYSQVNASANHAFAAGTQAVTVYPGTFTWADHANASGFNAVIANEFAARATGGVRFVTAVNGATPTAGVQLAAGGGSWLSMSDRNAKTDIAAVDVDDVLDRVAALPLQTWRYLTQDSTIRHIGPMAQDFYAAFGVGEDERHITAVDADGVALAAVQGLLQRFRAMEQRVAELEHLLAAQVHACALLTQAEVEAATGRKVTAPIEEQLPQLSACAFGDPDGPKMGGKPMFRLVTLTVLTLASAGAARDVYALGKGNAAAPEVVAGLGDEAFWDDILHALRVRYGSHELSLNVGTSSGGLKAAKTLAGKALARLR